MAKLKEKFKKEISKYLMQKIGYKNPMQVPCIKKIVINRGVGEARENPKAVDISAKELADITGQKPRVNKSKKAIAAFKLRANLAIGLTVTLRNERMYDFLDKLVNVCLPKIRDFQGVNPKSFDGRGNYNFGIREQLIFPEVDYDKVDRIRGMDITIVTSANTDQEARDLLEALGMPFRKEG